MNPRKILLADDEEALRFLLTETLADEGYDIMEAADGQEAVELLSENDYDLVILDYMMPERTGVEVCEWLRSQPGSNRNAPVILLTAKALDKDRERAREAGVTQYIVKPFSPLQLVETVEELIEQRSPQEGIT
ncbi:Response regulator receiver domain-containing protein [Paenibacillus sp. UNCCL117]|uniref:response regulator n=1 Tax=unclassified Paenibacillus TaxID=185978 RepID=UPI00088D89E5|nr:MULTISPECIES: response regulator [unclassified Paenibacillus]SDB99303.1 Response regulator receiver domain-containing protein [Paenibacillus sp. cl123]SFW69100.1 Response regulator receiver domain-containing protein [Paenibacillus sp. UNCCL117]